MTDPGRRGGTAVSLLLALWLVLGALPLLALLAHVGPAQVFRAFLALGREEGAARALRFGLAQAGGSLLVSLIVGLPGAWFVARYRFPGRGLLRALMVVPFSLPPVLVALGFALYYGRNGFLNRALMSLFQLAEPPLPLLYSFAGLCVVHGFYNFPLVLDIVGSALERLSPTRAEAARSLGAPRLRAFMTASLPALLPALAQAASLAFLFSFFSFVVVLLFGPLGAATPETEIWRSLRLEGDFPRAAAYALVQSLMALAVLALFALSSVRLSANASERAEGGTRRTPGLRVGLALGLYGLLVAIFFLAPLLSIGLESLSDRRAFGPLSFPALGSWARVFESGLLARALLHTMGTALPAAFLATGLGLLLGALLKGRPRSVAVFANLPLAISGVVAAAGWQLLLPRAGILALILIQALAALPFSLRSSSAALAALSPEPSRQARLLGAGRLRALLEVELPAILPLTLSSAAFSFALAAGDATSPLVLGLSDFEPLPLAIYRLAGAYRYPEACALGVVLAGLTGLVFWLKGRGNDRA